jgi:hypothetical protein
VILAFDAMTKRSAIILCLASAITIAVVACIFWPSPTVDQVMKDFYSAEGRAEDMLMDPLILNAELVAPRVIQSIQDKGMDKRRYAIGFLGNERIVGALPVLRRILADGSEEYYFRVDALEAIYQINREEGLSLARDYSERGDLLGRIATGLLSGDHRPLQRTYAEALFGRHG